MHKRFWNIFQKCFSRFHIQKEKLLKSCEKKLWRMKDFGSIFDLEIIRDYPDKCFHPSIIICMEKNMQNMQKKRYKKFSETETSCLNQLSAFLAFFLFPGSQKKLCGIMRDYVVRTPPPGVWNSSSPKNKKKCGQPPGRGSRPSSPPPPSSPARCGPAGRPPASARPPRRFARGAAPARTWGGNTGMAAYGGAVGRVSPNSHS